MPPPRSRATRVPLGADITLLVASLSDVCESKRVAAREKDVAVMSILETTLAEARRQGVCDDE